MVRINFQEPVEDQNWQIWRSECNEETSSFISAVQNGSADQYKVKDLYKKGNIKNKYFFNDAFKGPFWRKCAYCEESTGSQNGDVEHFRPKKRISDDNYKPLANHPGYYWLAYEWKNLLPSCLKCNQRRIWETENGEITIGKQDRFPLLENSPRISIHTDNIDNEHPLLINPLIEDPEDHLGVELKTGIMFHKSLRGKKCIEIFGLNIRDDLRDGRKGSVERIKALLIKLCDQIEEGNSLNVISTLQEILKFVNGEKRFSLAARCYLKEIIGSNYRDWVEGKLNEYINH